MYWEMFINNVICECPVDRARFQKRFVHTQTPYITRAYLRKSIRIGGWGGRVKIRFSVLHTSGRVRYISRVAAQRSWCDVNADGKPISVSGRSGAEMDSGQRDICSGTFWAGQR